jgi:hypothetical protein
MLRNGFCSCEQDRDWAERTIYQAKGAIFLFSNVCDNFASGQRAGFVAFDFLLGAIAETAPTSALQSAFDHWFYD